MECNVETTGRGDVIMYHNFDFDTSQSIVEDGVHHYRLTYSPPSTEDEMQDMIFQSDSCNQTISVSNEKCISTIKWLSLNGDEWIVRKSGAR